MQDDVALPEATPSPFGCASFLVGQTRSALRNQKENPTINVGINLQIIKAKFDYFAGFSTGAFGPFGGNGIIGSN